ncbi:MAG: hypothetical protein L0Y66_21270 [Myxococcaceae bacterium]|nr:hypothetical protein [Myxococcaceae bacterium]
MTFHQRLFTVVYMVGLLHVGGRGQLERYLASSRALLAGDGFDVSKHLRAEQLDILVLGDRAFTVAPPAVSVALTVPLAIARALAGSLEQRAPAGFAALVELLYAALVSAPLLAGASLALYRACKKLCGDEARARWCALGFGLGSGALFYSTHGVWGHGPAACALALALSGVILGTSAPRVGVALALAVLADYAALVPVAVIGALWLEGHWRTLSLRRLLGLCAPVAVAGMMLVAHNLATTGEAFETVNSAFRAQFVGGTAEAGRGMFSLPGPERLWGLTFSPYRGFFLYTPLALAVLVQFLVKRGRFPGRVPIFCAAGVLTVFAVNVSYYAWSGDSCFGPRHMLNSVPFWIVLLAWCDPRLLSLLVPVSMFVNVAGANTANSTNVFVNLAVFLYRGPHSEALNALYQEVLPVLTGARISLMTPFTVWVLVGAASLLLWRGGGTMLSEVLPADPRHRSE